jgi:hypothetical protein
MKTNKIPCILTDPEQQLELITDCLTSGIFRSGFKVCDHCGQRFDCSTNIIPYNNKWLQILELVNLDDPELSFEQSWFTIRKNQNDEHRLAFFDTINMLRQKHVKNFLYFYNAEVVMLDNTSNSPFCSALSTVGILRNCIDLNWMECYIQNIGGNHKK